MRSRWVGEHLVIKKKIVLLSIHSKNQTGCVSTSNVFISPYHTITLISKAVAKVASPFDLENGLFASLPQTDMVIILPVTSRVVSQVDSWESPKPCIHQSQSS